MAVSPLVAVRRWVLAILRGAARRLRGRDLSLEAAGLTFYAAIAVVPVLLIGLRGSAFLTSPSWVVARMNDIALLLPDALGARAVVVELGRTGATLSALGIAIALFPATFYGEGLRRSLLTGQPLQERWKGWRGRLAIVPLIVAAPFLATAMLVVGGQLSEWTLGGGVGAGVLRIWLGFIATWIVLTAVLAWVFGVVAPARTRPKAVVAGAAFTASMLAGFTQGFVLFLAIPVDLGAPFGGYSVAGAFVAVGLWMFLLHVVVLMGWSVTVAVAEHGWGLDMPEE